MSENIINLGTFTAPYREFTITIAPNEIKDLRYDHQFIEILENNLPYDVTCCFGGVGGFTTLEQGILYRYPNNNIIPYIQFKNNNPSNTATLKVAVAVGDMKDNRLNVSGIVNVESSTSNPIYAYSDVYTSSYSLKYTIGATGSVSMSYFATGNYKKVLIQNTSNADLRIENATDGFILPPKATFEWKVTNKSLTFYGTQGQTIWCEGYK